MELARIVVDDFGGAPIAEHNMPCAVCGREHAVLCLNNGTFEPCWNCQRAGWVLIDRKRLPWWRRVFVPSDWGNS
jgi:hypothetical protein